MRKNLFWAFCTNLFKKYLQFNVIFILSGKVKTKIVERGEKMLK